MEITNQTYKYTKESSSVLYTEDLYGGTLPTFSTLPLSPDAYTVIGSFLLVSVVIGIFENGIVLIVFYKNKELRTTTNAFVLSLATADFLMCATGTPVSMSSNLSRRWLWGDAGCTYEGFIIYFLGCTQLYTLSVISINRYIVIAKPLYKAMITKRVTVLSVGFCWFMGLFWAIMPVFGWNSFEKEAQGTSCTIVWRNDGPAVISYTMTIFFACLILPLGVTIFCYYGVFMTIRTISRNGIWDMNSRVARKNLKIERKLAKTIALMIGAYLISWLPYAIVSFWAAFGKSEEIPVIVSAIPAVIAKSSTIWNPLIYFATNKQFRKAFYTILPCARLRSTLTNCRNEEREKEESEMYTIDKTSNKARPGTSGHSKVAQNKIKPATTPSQTTSNRTADDKVSSTGSSFD